MQHTLTFTEKGKKYVSKPFDFKAMCIVNDAHNDESKHGPLNMCAAAVDYMFEGTEASEEVINALPVSTRAQLCTKVWDFYVEAWSVKND